MKPRRIEMTSGKAVDLGDKVRTVERSKVAWIQDPSSQSVVRSAAWVLRESTPSLLSGLRGMATERCRATPVLEASEWGASPVYGAMLPKARRKAEWQDLSARLGYPLLQVVRQKPPGPFAQRAALIARPLGNRSRYVHRHIPRPLFARVEGDDPDGPRELSAEYVIDDCALIGLGLVGLTIRAEAPSISPARQDLENAIENTTGW
jgi:hypothetical protein